MPKANVKGKVQNLAPNEVRDALREDVTRLKGRFAGRTAKRISVAAMDQAIGAEVADSYKSIDKGLGDAVKLKKRP
ncbi:MAG: hypothetical protein ABIN37_11580 [Burkholderiaceae bacterium]